MENKRDEVRRGDILIVFYYVYVEENTTTLETSFHFNLFMRTAQANVILSRALSTAHLTRIV